MTRARKQGLESACGEDSGRTWGSGGVGKGVGKPQPQETEGKCNYSLSLPVAYSSSPQNPGVWF